MEKSTTTTSIETNKKITNESIKSWVNENTNGYSTVLTKSNFIINGTNDNIKKYLDWSECGNGLGDRYARKLFIYTVIYGNGKTKLYPISENVNTDNNQILQDFINAQINNVDTNSRGIVGIFIHSLCLNVSKRPIKKSIGDEVRKRCCVVCGTRTDIVCDHKNDLYNDPRVLCTDTQIIDDFQALCNHCNLQKRQVSINEMKSGELFSAKNLPLYSQFQFDFVWEKKILDLNDIHCKVGTYWYDPVMFQKQFFQYVTNIQNVPLIG
jgi:hypothetical protein